MGFNAGPPLDGAVALLDIRGVLDNIVPGARPSAAGPAPGQGHAGDPAVRHRAA
jgi:hypothetical protein